ncbi:hypothetical protein NUM3379_44180 [Kineococcus sp. NUM-3379]
MLTGPRPQAPGRLRGAVRALRGHPRPGGAYARSSGPLALRSAALLLPVLAVGLLVQWWGAGRSPERLEAEAALVARAWSLTPEGRTSPGPVAGSPPLAELQVAVWLELSGALERAGSAVAAGREAVLVATAVTALLLWVLARRLALPRWAAAVAVLLFTLPPAAVVVHRGVHPENLAAPWAVGALVLVASPGRRLPAFAGAGLAYAVAVLTAPSWLLLAPAVASLLWQRSEGPARGRALAAAASLFVVPFALLAASAALRGEPLGALAAALPGSLTAALGTALPHPPDAGTLLLPALLVAAGAAGLVVRRLRPVAVGALVVGVALALRGPGRSGPPVPAAAVALPLVALLPAGVAAAAWRRWRNLAGHRSPALRAAQERAGVALGALALVAVATTLAAAVLWPRPLLALTTGDPDAATPASRAAAWVGAEVPRGERVGTDGALGLDLLLHGRARADVVPAGAAAGAGSWEWLLSTRAVREEAGRSPALASALAGSDAVAVFGSGGGRVEVRRAPEATASPAPAGTAAPAAPAAPAGGEATEAARAQAGAALTRNPALGASPEAAAVLRSGRADPRLLVLLAALAQRHDLEVVDLPAVVGEDAAGRLRRTVQVARVDGAAVAAGEPGTAALLEFTRAQRAPYAPSVAELTPRGASEVLTVRLPLDPASAAPS